MGLMAFVPEDFIDWSIAESKKIERQVKTYIKERKRLRNDVSSADSPDKHSSLDNNRPVSIRLSSPKANIFHLNTTVSRRKASITFGGISTTENSENEILRLLPTDLAPAGHERSEFLMSQYWEKGILGQDYKSYDSANHDRSEPSASFDIQQKWSTRWCEVWKAPPAMCITSSQGKKIWVSLEGCLAEYM